MTEAITHFRARKRKKGRDDDDDVKMTSSQGRTSAAVGGEFRATVDPGDDRYAKKDKIGTGSVGCVYKAQQILLNREVALKELDHIFELFPDQRDEVVRRFSDISCAAARLVHPHILAIHDVNFKAEKPFVVTDLAPNGSVRELVRVGEPMPVGRALMYLLQTLQALRLAHANNVIHRGIKPENLLIDGTGSIQVSDFGVAKLSERDSSSRQLYVGSGNIAYMAPELYSEGEKVGRQIDIYALGIVFYEMLAARIPGRRAPMPSEINTEIPKGVDKVFDLMTRDSTTERYSSVDDVLKDMYSLGEVRELLDPLRATMSNAKGQPPKKRVPPVPQPSRGEAKANGSAGAPAAPEQSHRPYSFQVRNKSD